MHTNYLLAIGLIIASSFTVCHNIFMPSLYPIFNYWPKKYPQYQPLPDSTIELGPKYVSEYVIAESKIMVEQSRQRMIRLRKQLQRNPVVNAKTLALYKEIDRKRIARGEKPYV